MKYSVTTLLILVFWVGLVALAVHNFRRTVAFEREYIEVAFENPLEHVFSLVFNTRPRSEYARQQIRLCELALASKPEPKVMEAAEEKFRAVQQRYGQLQIEDADAVAIVSIPEMWFPEHRAYSWRIYVPPNQHVELAAYMGDGNNDAPSNKFAPSSFVQPLSAGESVIQFLYEEHDQRKHAQHIWGSFAAKDIATWQPRLQVAIKEDNFRWQSVCSNGFGISVYPPTKYPNQQTLFGSEDTVELIRVDVGLYGGSKENMHLVVRQSKLTTEE